MAKEHGVLSGKATMQCHPFQDNIGPYCGSTHFRLIVEVVAVFAVNVKITAQCAQCGREFTLSRE